MLKKYLLLIPTLFVMLLNVIGCGQVVYAADSDVDYSLYYKDIEEFPEVLSTYDFTNYDQVVSDLFSEAPEYYLIYAYVQFSSYDSYFSSDVISGSICDLYFIDLTDVEFKSNDYYLTNTYSADFYFARYNFDKNRHISYSNFSKDSYYKYFIYSPFTGCLSFQSSPFDLSNSDSVSEPSHYSYYIYTNHPDIQLPDFAYTSGSDQLKVDVKFDPALSGIVDRNVSGSFVSSFNMTITNNSKSPIQYRMAIFEGNVNSFDSCYSPYNNSNCIFTYMSHDWIYSKDVSKMRSLTATDNLLLQNVGTSWHYLEGKSSFSQTFNYSQINFSKDKTYSVVVEAGLTNLDHASSYFVENIVSLNRVENLDKENLKYILDYSTFSTVFSSTFSFDSLKGISYDSSDNSFGIIANSSGDDYTYATHDREAFYDENGNFDYTSYNPFDDEDSYVYNSPIKSPEEWKDENNIIYDDSLILGSINSSVGFSSGDFSFGSGFSNFGNMLASVFNIFPSNFWKMFTAGFISIIIIAIVKAVK